MSLINKMLTDLEARQRPAADTAPSYLYGDLHPAAGKGRCSRRVVPLLLVLLLFAALGFLARDRLTETGAFTEQLLDGTGVRELGLLPIATPVAEHRQPEPRADTADVTTPVISALPTQAPAPVIASVAPAPSPVAAPTQTLAAKEPGADKAAPKPAVAAKAKSKPKPKAPHGATTRGSAGQESAKQVMPTSIQPQHEQSALGREKLSAAPRRAPDSPELGDTPQRQMEKKLRSLTPEEQAENAYREAVRHLQESRLADAEETLREALAQNPRHVDARELLVGLITRAGQTTEAERLLEEGRSLVPDHYRFAQLLARIYARAGAEDRALTLLEQVEGSAQKDAGFQGLLATLYQRAGRHRDAIKAYGRAVILSPDQSQWWLGLGISLEAERSWGAAYSSYLRAVGGRDLDPNLAQYAKQRLVALRPRVTAPAAPKAPAVAQGELNGAAN